VSLFKYLTDKDVFMMVYSKLLSKRLIGDLSASEDAESQMIQKLKVFSFYYYCFSAHLIDPCAGCSRI
jgi:cullin 1